MAAILRDIALLHGLTSGLPDALSKINEHRPFQGYFVSTSPSSRPLWIAFTKDS